MRHLYVYDTSFAFEITAFYFLITTHGILSFFVDEIYQTLETRFLWNDNFVLQVDYMSDLVTTASRRQAVDLKLQWLPSHFYKWNN